MDKFFFLQSKRKIYLYIGATILLVQILFDVVLYHDLLLFSSDINYQFEKLRNLILYDKSFYEFNPNSIFYWDKFDLYEFYTVYLNKFVFHNIFSLDLIIKNFAIFQISKKIFLVAVIFLFFLKAFKSKILAICCTSIVLLDGSFTHSIHNIHFYLTLFVLLSVFIFCEQKLISNIYLKSLIIGVFLTFGSGSIVSTGLTVGFSALYISFKNLLKKKINFSILIFFFIGFSIVTTIFLIENYKIIIENKELIFNFRVSQNDIGALYTAKTLLSNFFYFIFGQHGNNILTILLIILFFNRSQITAKKDYFLFDAIQIFFIVFIVLGLIIDPLHYYPSRMGFITPVVLYILAKLYLNNKLIFSNFLISIILFLLVGGIINQISNINYNPNTTEKSLLVATITIMTFLILKYLIFVKHLNKFILFLIVFSLIIKFLPNYNYSQLQSLINKNKKDFLENTIKEFTEEKNYNCIISNYALRELFSTDKLFEIKTSGEHLNKKGAFGNKPGGCDLLILIVDKQKSDLNIIKKINFIKKNSIPERLSISDYFTFRNHNYEIYDTVLYKNIFIYISELTNKSKDELANQIYLSVY